MKWTVKYSKRAAKQAEKLPNKVLEILDLLVAEIELSGPVRGNWPNYSKLGGMLHHCHIKKGKPTYVAVWEEDESGIRLVEVKYVGTHEKAPY
jgi:mRNA-degrading endonuclease RelE of RelBE toxin-antitoxin system